VELLLIRHALPLRTELEEGPADPELSGEGWGQAGKLAAWLAAETFGAVYTSPLRRAVQTAEPLAEIMGLAATALAGLSEWDRQASSYIPIEELQATDDPMWRSLARGALDELGIDAPSFQTHVVETIDGIAQAHPSQTIAVVCHGGVINAYLSDVLGLDRVLFFRPDYTCINRVWVSSSGIRSLRTLNETAHLRVR
jgi:2,3-bisphosphoglycerate-dependent phosphoglycerate mutase